MGSDERTLHGAAVIRRKSMRAPLSPHEETALRKVGFGSGDQLELAHVRRLLHLDLIEWNGRQWSLTEAGRRRYSSVASSEQQQ